MTSFSINSVFQPVPYAPVIIKFDRSSDSFHSFINTCTFYFEGLPFILTTEHLKMSFIITSPTAQAQIWAVLMLEKHSPFFDSAVEFLAALSRMFCQTGLGSEATPSPSQLRSSSTPVVISDSHTTMPRTGSGNQETISSSSLPALFPPSHSLMPCLSFLC